MPDHIEQQNHVEGFVALQRLDIHRSKFKLRMAGRSLFDHGWAEIDSQPAFWVQSGELVPQAATHFENAQPLRHQVSEIAQLILVVISGSFLPACPLERQPVETFGNFALAKLVSLHAPASMHDEGSLRAMEPAPRRPYRFRPPRPVGSDAPQGSSDAAFLCGAECRECPTAAPG